MNPITRRGFGNAMMIGLGVGAQLSDPRGNLWCQTTEHGRAIRGDMTTKSDVFKPGDTVPSSGIYDVDHDKLDGDDHAQPHQVTALHGEIFPPCRCCQDLVRFRLNQAAEHVLTHDHFKP